MDKKTYRIPLIHCLLACVASLILGVGIGYSVGNYQKRSTAMVYQPDFVIPGNINPSLTPNPEDLTTLTLYFNNTKFNPAAEDCAAVYPVNRKIHKTNAPLQEAAMLLFAGPTTQEKSLGYSSVFSDKTIDLLKYVTFSNGKVSIDFKKAALLEAIKAGANSSCGGDQFISSIKRTFLGITGVKTVDPQDFTVEGSKDAYQDLMKR